MMVSVTVRKSSELTTHHPNAGTPLQFSKPEYRIPEYMGPVEVCVELTSNLSIPLTVRFTTQDTNTSEAAGQFASTITYNHTTQYTGVLL